MTTAGGMKTVQHVTTSQAGAGQGVKMIVVSSGQLSGTSTRPVMMSLSGASTGVKTVSVRGAAGGQQILTLPSGGQLAGNTQTMMIGGKPVTVLTSGAAAGQLGAKTVQLVSAGQQPGQQVVQMAGGQPMVVMQSQAASATASSGPVTSDAALAQLAAEAGLLEGESGDGDLAGGQLDGGYVTPQDGVSEIGDPMDIQQYLDLFQTQVDGDPGDIESEAGEETENKTENTTGNNTEVTEETAEQAEAEKSIPESEEMDTSNNVENPTPSEPEPSTATETEKTEDVPSEDQ